MSSAFIAASVAVVLTSIVAVVVFRVWLSLHRCQPPPASKGAILAPPIPAPSPAPEPSPIPPPPPIQLPQPNYQRLTQPLPSDDTQVIEVGGLPRELVREPARRNHRRYEPPAKPRRPDPLDTTTVLPRLEPARLGGERTGEFPRISGADR